MKRDDLYFILNPALGIIKIGIAGDVNARRQQLEHGCGVPLEVLRVVVGGCGLEKPLHDAFGRDRLMGEWFAPTAELLALADGTEIIDDYLERVAEQTAAWVKEHEEEMDRRKAEQLEAARQAREEAKRIREAEKELKARRQAAIAKAREKVEQKRDEQAAKQRAAVAELQSKWSARDFDTAGKLIRPAAAETAQQRRETVAQRRRNAAFNGVSPLEKSYETLRGAAMGASEGT